MSVEDQRRRIKGVGILTPRNASDASYHTRHTGRSLRRAERIAANIGSPGHVLDVGCNNGITSRFLLDSGKATRATGIELHSSTVDADVLADDRFTLIEGNIVDLELPARYDICVYGAVHHHILNFNGLSAAVATLQKLAQNCERQIFIETGQVGEGGRWDWQHAIRRYFRTDEEHLCYLLQTIEQHVCDVSLIGKFWIHGIRRSYIRVDLRPRDERAAAVVPGPVIPCGGDVEGPLYRNFGSRTPALSAAAGGSDSPTAFWISGRDDGDRFFFKQHRHRPMAAEVEWRIAGAVTPEWAVKPVGAGPMPATLAFPYLASARPLADFADAPGADRQDLAQQMLAIFTDAGRIRVPAIVRPLLGTDGARPLDELCDLNRNNFLVEYRAAKPRVRVIDFEQHGTHYRYRNRMHLAAMLFVLRRHRVRAAWFWLSGAALGVLWLCRAQCWPVEKRLRRHQPSLASLLVAETRSLSGRMLRGLLSLVGLK